MTRYGDGMMECVANPAQAESVELVLRDELAAGDAVLGSVSPILQHLLGRSGNALFGDEIVAGVRGMAADLARQLLDATAKAAGEADWRASEILAADDLLASLVDNTALLRHMQALAVEAQLCGRLQARLAIDPVLPPLLQSLVASPQADLSASAMNLLAAQARFIQSQRRMKLALHELPADLFHGVLLAYRAVAGEHSDSAGLAETTASTLRSQYDEAATRLGLIARLATSLGGAMGEALALGNAGLSIFVTVLSLACGQDRDVCALMTSESQMARFVLSLRAAGLRQDAVAEQLFALHPDVDLPEGFDSLGPDRAAAILAAAGG